MPSSESCSLYVRDLFISQKPRQTNRAAGNLPRLFCAKPKDGRLPNLNQSAFRCRKRTLQFRSGRLPCLDRNRHFPAPCAPW